MEKEQKDCCESLEEFLEEKGKIELLRGMRYFEHYPHEEALLMLENKQTFVSFLLGLQKKSPKDYSFLTGHAKKAKAFIALFTEWLIGNPVFLKKELGYCPELRTPEFKKVFLFNKQVPGFTSIFLQYLVAHIMVQ